MGPGGRGLSSLRRSGVLALALLAVLLTACSDLERTAYRTFAVTRAEYEMIQQQVAEEAVHGLITEEQWNRFRVQGHRFIAAYNTAVDAFELWSRLKTQENTARLQSVLESLPRLLGDLRALVQSFQKEPQPEVRFAPSEVEGSQDSEERRRTRSGFAPPSDFWLLTSNSYEAPWR